MPSHFCGIFGHMTTPGVVSTDGLSPEINAGKRTYCSIGPMCRYSEDLLPVLKVMATGSEALPRLQLDEPVDLSNIKIYYMDSIDGNGFLTPVHPSIRN